MLKEKENIDFFIEEIKKSNNFVKKNVKYPHPSIFLEAFGEVSRLDFEKPIEVAEGEVIYKAYPKFLLEKYLLRDEKIEGFRGTIGLIANYNSNKVIVYSGATAMACLNLSIFGADYIKEYELLDSTKVVTEILSKAYDNLSFQLERIKQIKEKLERRVYSQKEFEHRKGEILSIMDISLIPYLKHAEEQFRSKDSLYYDMPNTDWKLLAAMTDLIKNQGVTARVRSTIKLENLFV